MTLKSAPRRIRQIALLVASLMIAAVTVAQTDELAEAGKLFRGGQQAQALERVDNVLKTNPKDARGRFLDIHRPHGRLSGIARAVQQPCRALCVAGPV
jgi:hypothetical protein